MFVLTSKSGLNIKWALSVTIFLNVSAAQAMNPDDDKIKEQNTNLLAVRQQSGPQDSIQAEKSLTKLKKIYKGLTAKELDEDTNSEELLLRIELLIEQRDVDIVRQALQKLSLCLATESTPQSKKDIKSANATEVLEEIREHYVQIERIFKNRLEKLNLSIQKDSDKVLHEYALSNKDLEIKNATLSVEVKKEQEKSEVYKEEIVFQREIKKLEGKRKSDNEKIILQGAVDTVKAVAIVGATGATSEIGKLLISKARGVLASSFSSSRNILAKADNNDNNNAASRVEEVKEASDNQTNN